MQIYDPNGSSISDHLVAAPAPAVCGTQSEIAIDRPYGAFVYSGPGVIEPIGPQPELKRRFLGFDRLGSFIDAQGDGGAQIFRNRLRLREGPGAIDAEHIAGLASGIHLSLLNSHPDAVSDDAPISLFNAWPKDWDAAFTLLARGAFVISSAQRDGTIPLVEIVSKNGGMCRLNNPWTGRSVTLYRNGHKEGELSGEVLSFPTSKGETVIVVPRPHFSERRKDELGARQRWVAIQNCSRNCFYTISMRFHLQHTPSLVMTVLSIFGAYKRR